MHLEYEVGKKTRDMENDAHTIYTKDADGSRFSRRTIALVGIVLLVIVVPVILLLIRQEQDVRQSAQTPSPATSSNVVVAEVGEDVISSKSLEDYIKTTWGPYATTALASPELRKQALDQMVERLLISQEAAEKSLSVTSEDYEAYLQENSAAASQQNASSSDTAGVMSQLLQQKVEKEILHYIVVDTAGVFVAPESETYSRDFTQAQNTLTTLRTRASGTTALSTALERIQGLNTTYPGISIQEDVQVTRSSDWEPQLRDPLFQLEVGDVSSVLDTGAGSLLIAKVKEIHEGEYDSWEEWVLAQKQTKVKYY